MDFFQKSVGSLCLLVAFTACNRQPLATFQRTPQEVFVQEKKTQVVFQSSENNMREISPLRKKEVLTARLNDFEISDGFEFVQTDKTSKKQIKEAKIAFKSLSLEEKKQAVQLATSTPKKNVKKTMGFWDELNEKLKIGATLLGISIIFAILGIKLIATIFAIGAIFFIVKGLKRVY